LSKGSYSLSPCISKIS